jgi:hypothetical protein
MSDYLIFGNTEESHTIAPDTSQSICILDIYASGQKVFYYLDNSPTLESLNDSLNAMGNLTVLFTDLDGNPLRNYQVGYYDPKGIYPSNYTLTDEDGEFSLHDYSMKIKFHDKDYKNITWEQILPEENTYDTIRIDMTKGVLMIKILKMNIC